MNLLLDTHIVLWALSDDLRLSDKARDLISDPDNNIFFSSVSVWEILLKNSSPGNNLKLTSADFVKYCEDAGYYPLNLASKHVIEASELDVSVAEEQGHRDPFDRILLAQAKAENYSFLTHDSKFKYYNEKCVIEV